MDNSGKEVNVVLANLEGLFDDAHTLAEKCEASNLNFPVSTLVQLNRTLVKVCRENAKLIFDLRERVAALEKLL